MNLSKIYSKAWELIKKHKILWLFGFFAGCGQASGGSDSGVSVGNNNDWQTSIENISNTDFMGFFPAETQRWMLDAEQFIKDSPEKVFGYAVLLFMAVFTISLLFAALRIYGQIGIVSGVVLSEKGTEKLDFSNINPEVGKYFWRIVFLFLIAFVGVLVTSGLVWVTSLTIILALPALCCFFFFILIASLLLNQTFVALIVEDLNPLEAFKQAWTLFFANIPLYLSVGAINFFSQMIINIVLIIPFVGLLGVLAIFRTFNLVSIIIGFLILGTISSLLLAPVTTFFEATWVYTYLQAAKVELLTSDGEEEELTELEAEVTPEA